MKKAKLSLLSLLLIPALGTVVTMEQGPTGVKRAASLVSNGTYRADYDSLSATEDAAADLNIKLAEEGTVLLKNKDNALPLSVSSEKKITVLGEQADCMLTGGSGSGGQNKPAGDNTPATAKTLFDSLEDAGFEVNPSVKSAYEAEDAAPKSLSNGNPYEAGHYMAKVDAATSTSVDFAGNHYEPLGSGVGTLGNATLTGYDSAAIVLISRTGAEGNDNLTHNLPNYDSITDDYMSLNTSEKEMIAYAKKNFHKVVIVLNTPGAMELGDVEDDDGIASVLWIGQTGWNGIMALGKILKGEVNPSGRTSDLYMRDIVSDPTWYNFGNYTQSDYILNAETNQTNITGSGAAPFGYDAAYAVDNVQNGNYKTIDYAEGIYYGYRYYETAYAELSSKKGKEAADAWYKKAVVYPYGYGLSYSSFSQEITSISKESITSKDDTLTVKVKVTNTGSLAGKEVVQLYSHAPYTEGEIEKADAVLVAFAKTSLLQPNASEEVTLTVAAKDLASFDYNDANGDSISGYELEAGDYILSARKNSHDVLSSKTIKVASTLSWDEDGNADTPNNIFSQSGNAWEMYNTSSDHWTVSGEDHYLHRNQIATDSGIALEETYTPGNPNDMQKQLGWLIADQSKDDVFKESAFVYLNSQEPDYAYLDKDNRLTPTVETDYQNVWVKENGDIPSDWSQGNTSVDKYGLYPLELSNMKNVSWDDSKWDTFMNQFTWKELVRICQDGGYGSDAVDTVGKPANKDHDGPGQMRKNWTTTADGNGYAWVCEAVIASTFNTELAEEQGKIVGNEGIFLGVTGWYAPGANIHRNANGGRNFEYYSSDPIHAGNILAAVIAGYQSKGGKAYMKHSFLNEQETSRSGIVTFATEQAIREIYAKPFEIATRKSDASGMMTSFNRIGLQSSVSYAINQQMYANEWNYHGMTVTDAYYTYSGWDSEAMVRGSVIPLNSGFAIFPPATAIEGEWDATLRNGKGGVKVANANGEMIESPTQYYYARITAKRAMYSYANANDLTGLSARMMLASKTQYFGNAKSVKSATYSASEISAFYTAMDNLYGKDEYEVNVSGLPTGLSLDLKTGELTGTVPATPGHYTYTITVSGKGKLSYITRTITNTLNITAPVYYGDDVSIDFQMPVTMVEGDNYIPTAKEDRKTTNSALEGKYVEVSYSATGLPEGLTMDPATGKITGKLKNRDTAGKRYEVEITQKAVYGEPWGFMPGFMFSNKTYTTTVYIEYQSEAVGITDISTEKTDDGTLVTITLSNGETSTFLIPDGKDGEKGSDGANGSNGSNGADGKDGVGIKSIESDEDGNLIITLSDGSTEKVTLTKKSSGGCGGSVIAATSIVGALALLGTGLILKKKKEEK